MAVGGIVRRLWVLAIVVIAIGAAIDGEGPVVAAWFQGESAPSCAESAKRFPGKPWSRTTATNAGEGSSANAS
jgi:hypothetical protein